MKIIVSKNSLEDAAKDHLAKDWRTGGVHQHAVARPRNRHRAWESKRTTTTC